MKAKNGDTVKVHYTLKDINGNEVESSSKSDPIEFKIGEGKTIPGFDKGVTGMAVNESKTINNFTNCWRTMAQRQKSTRLCSTTPQEYRKELCAP